MLPVRFGAVLAATAGQEVAPGWSLGAELAIDVASRAQGWNSPSGRWSVSVSESSSRDVFPGASARYRLIATSGSLCPVRLTSLPRFGLRPCALVQVGDLQGSGEIAGVERTKHMLWLGFGAAARAEFAPTDWLSLEVEARELVLTRHDRFAFSGPPDRVAHDVAPTALELAAGLLIRLP